MEKDSNQQLLNLMIEFCDRLSLINPDNYAKFMGNDSVAILTILKEMLNEVFETYSVYEVDLLCHYLKKVMDHQTGRSHEVYRGNMENEVIGAPAFYNYLLIGDKEFVENKANDKLINIAVSTNIPSDKVLVIQRSILPKKVGKMVVVFPKEGTRKGFYPLGSINTFVRTEKKEVTNPLEAYIEQEPYLLRINFQNHDYLKKYFSYLVLQRAENQVEYIDDSTMRRYTNKFIAEELRKGHVKSK